MRSFLETAMHHALNGFEVVLADMKSHGFASGVRGSLYTSFDWHEQIGVLLQQCPTDKPLFVQCHSQGCQSMQTFLIKNKGNEQIKKIAGIIYGAPYFDVHEMMNITLKKKLLMELVNIDDLSDVSFLNLFLSQYRAL
jgi:alpha-beta hydrolase superfamily lysophospholipase